jgi:hypothetical protein
MPAPLPKTTAAKPFDLTEEDLVDRTMELDMRWLQYEKDDDSIPADKRVNRDEPTVVLDLTATQVHELLSDKKKK